MRIFISLACSIGLFPLFAPGCAAPDGADTPTGTLELPLQQSGSDGALYRLSADFDIEGTGISTLFRSTGAEPEISLAVAPGLATVTILDGWTLTRSADNGGTFQPVSAVLGSLRAQQVRVLANHTDSVVFEFLVRSTSGDLTIDFGVATHPRELAGAVVIDQGTNAFAAYPQNTVVDFATYYQLLELDKTVLPDGSKDRVVFSDTSATEYFNDGVGALSDIMTPALQGALVQWHLVAKPDGSQELSGEIDGQIAPFPRLTFGPHTFVSPLPLDPDGFMSDVFFFETIPFTVFLFDNGNSTMNGTMRFRSIPAGN